MAATIKQTEAIPASYPLVNVTDAALPYVTAAWQRIEGYIAHRFTERAATWIVEGPGEWSAPLTPATVTATEIWQDDAWTSVTLTAGPMGGYVLDGEGPYRITADVGSGTAPAAIIEACRRLAEYMAGEIDAPGARSVSLDIPGVENRTIEREPSWIARAMQHSGAADLLRPYRRA